MNDLSWMIYAADVAGNVKVAAVLGLVALLFFAVPATVVGCCSLADGDEKFGKAIFAKMLRLWWVPTVLIFGLIAVPSTATIYAIAASEMGEEIIETETAGKAMQVGVRFPS